jgi:hypothetical protein
LQFASKKDDTAAKFPPSGGNAKITIRSLLQRTKAEIGALAS